MSCHCLPSSYKRYSAILGLVEWRKRIPDRQPQSQLEATAAAFLRLRQDALKGIRLSPPVESRPRHRGREPRYCGLISSSRRKFPFPSPSPSSRLHEGKIKKRGAPHLRRRKFAHLLFVMSLPKKFSCWYEVEIGM